MAKVFEFDARKGSYIDQVSKIAGTPTNVTFNKKQKGNTVNLSSGKNINMNTPIVPDGMFSVVIWFNQLTPSPAVTNQLIGVLAQGNAFSISTSFVAGLQTLIYYNNGKWVNYPRLDSYGYKCVIITYDGGTTNIAVSTKMYVNNNLVNSISSDNTSPTIISRTNATYIGNTSNTASTDIVLIRSYNHILTTDERNQLYKEFLESTITEKPTRNFEYPKPTDLGYEGDSVVGTNLTNNYNFTSGWSNLAAENITSNSFYTSVAGRGIYFNCLTIGKKYRVIVDGTSNASFSLRTTSGSANQDLLQTGFGTYEFTAQYTGLYLRGGGAGTTTITKLITQELSGLVAAYSPSPMTVQGGQLLDISGNGNNGTISGAMLTKEGMKFDGVDDYIQVKTSALTNISINLRFKTASSARQSFIAGALNNSCIFINAGVIGSGTSLATGNATTKSTYADGNWHSLSVVKLGDSNFRFFIDGIEDTGGSNLGFRSATEFQIGCTNNSSVGLTPTLFYNGEISDIRIYNYAFTPEQAKAYHNSFIKPVILEDFSNNAVGDTL